MPATAPAGLPLVERRRRQTATRIVEAAVALFTERGYEATTADDIAELAGCSRATLFRYFRSKEDILFGDVYQLLREVRDELAGAHPCDDPWRTAKEIGISRFAAYLSGESALPRACIALWSSHEALRSRYLDINHQWERVLAEFFATERGVDPATDLASQLRANVAVSAVRAVLMAYSVPGTDLHSAIVEAFAMAEAGIS